MLVSRTSVLDYPVYSLHTGYEIGKAIAPIIDPEELSVVAYELAGEAADDPENGYILMVKDIREFSSDGFIIDSADRLVEPGDVIKLDKTMDLDFKLLGLHVYTKDGKKLGKVIDYILDSGSFSIYQVIVARPFFESFTDPELTINRSQIVEITDEKIIVKHSNQKVKIAKPNRAEDFVPNYFNPFRAPEYSEDKVTVDQSSSSSETDNSSDISE